MPRISHFQDEKKLIEITTKYLIENNLYELTGGYRLKSSPFSIISVMYFEGKNEPGAAACLYTKWNKNYNNFKLKVMNSLKRGFTIQDDPMDNYELVITHPEWEKLLKTVGGLKRKGFLASGNSFLAEKIRSHGFECDFKIKSNSFSTSRRPIFGHKFWRGVFTCKNCQEQILGFIQNQPKSNENVLLIIKANQFKCSNKKVAEPRKRITGEERKLLQYEICSKGSSNFWNEAKFFGDKSKLDIGYSNVRKMNSQHRHRYQLANDLRIDSDVCKNLFDNFLPSQGSRTLKGYIQEVHSNPYAALLISELQVKMWEIVNEHNPIWFFDATGNVMTRLKNQNEILMYSFVVHDTINKTSFPVADFMSSANDSITINSFITKIIEKFSLYHFFKKPMVVVTDFSWANIHAISKSFNNLEILDYLYLTFQILVEGKKYCLAPIKTLVYLCSTHLLKNIIDEADRVIKTKDKYEPAIIRKRFIKSFILLQNCDSMEKFCRLLVCIKNVFINEIMDEKYLESIAVLILAQKELDIDFIKNFNLPVKEYISETDDSQKLFFIENKNINFVRDSPFTEYFKQILGNDHMEVKQQREYGKNVYYNPELFKIITKKLHLLPLWSGVMFSYFNITKTRLSNNAVERWFGYFKNKLLMTNKRVRNCRPLFLNEVVTPLFFSINSKYKEFYEEKFNFKFDSLDKSHETNKDGKSSTEKYSFKYPPKLGISHYEHGYNFLKLEGDEFKRDISLLKINDLNFSNFFEKGTKKVVESSPEESPMEIEIVSNSRSKWIEGGIPKLPDKKINIVEHFKFFKISIDDLYFYKIKNVLITRKNVYDLKNDGWLSDTVMEAYGNTVISQTKRNIVLISSFHCTSISNNGFLIKEDDFKIDKGNAFIGFLNQDNNHWCLIYIDLRNNNFFYIDPKGEKARKKKRFFDNWRFFMEKKYQIKLSLQKLDHSFQKDQINCGVFSCFFLKQIINERPLVIINSLENLHSYRVEMNDLFEKMTSISFCSFCGAEFKDDDVVVLSDCSHRFHSKCKEFKNGFDLNLKKFKNFICPLCF